MCQLVKVTKTIEADLSILVIDCCLSVSTTMTENDGHSQGSHHFALDKVRDNDLYNFALSTEALS